MTENSSGIASEVVEHGALCTFHELCISCNVNPDWVAGLVEQGVIDAVGATRQQWQFTALSLLRVAKARRLERDLGLNLPGIALALELLDQLEELRGRLRSLQERGLAPARRPSTGASS
jgi:chaperone modulatory protein CbpM